MTDSASKLVGTRKYKGGGGGVGGGGGCGETRNE